MQKKNNTLLSVGGSRQRLNALNTFGADVGEGEKGEEAKSYLADVLVMIFRWGLITAVCVQWIAQAAVKDGMVNTKMLDLCNIGAEGIYAGNCRRDLMHNIWPKMKLCKYSTWSIPMKDKLGFVTPQPAFINALNRTFHSMFTASRTVFEKVFGCAGSNIRSFWHKVSPDDPKLKHLISILGPLNDWCDNMIPYKLHGDGYKFAEKNSQSLHTAQIKPFLSEGPEWAKWFLMFSCVKSACIVSEHPDEDTMHHFWSLAVHYLNALFNGKNHAMDHWGAPWPSDSDDAKTSGCEICGAYRFVCWATIGYLDFFGNDLHYPHHGSHNPCWFDSASRQPGTSVPMTHLSRDAGWKAT